MPLDVRVQELTETVEDKAAKLGLILPDGVVILPPNFLTAESADRFAYVRDYPSLKAAFERAGVPAGGVESDDDALGKTLFMKSVGTVALPMVFIGGSLLSQHPELVSVALGVVTNYVSDLFKAMKDRGGPSPPVDRPPRAEVELVVSGDGTVSIRVASTEDGLNDIGETVVRLLREARKKRRQGRSLTPTPPHTADPNSSAEPGVPSE